MVKGATLQSQNDIPQTSFYSETIDYSLFHSGDLIFRRGNGILSQTVLHRDRTSEFSHVGIIKIINNRPYVIHASPGKPLGTNAIVKLETIDDFLRDASVLAAVYRLNQNHVSLGNNASSLAHEYSVRKVPFDTQFSLKSLDKFYCTELVWQAYLQSGIDLVAQNFSTLSFPFNKEPYILPSDLLSSKHIYQVHQFEW